MRCGPQALPTVSASAFDDHRLVAQWRELLLPATPRLDLGLRELVEHHLGTSAARRAGQQVGSKMEWSPPGSWRTTGFLTTPCAACRWDGRRVGCVSQGAIHPGTFLRRVRWGHDLSTNRVGRQLLARACASLGRTKPTRAWSGQSDLDSMWSARLTVVAGQGGMRATTSYTAWAWLSPAAGQRFAAGPVDETDVMARLARARVQHRSSAGHPAGTVGGVRLRPEPALQLWWGPTAWSIRPRHRYRLRWEWASAAPSPSAEQSLRNLAECDTPRDSWTPIPYGWPTVAPMAWPYAPKHLHAPAE